jgi:hypothetical protein
MTMVDLEKVTYCGLYCGLCSRRNRTPRQAAALRDSMRTDGWELWAPHDLPGFTPFWGFLSYLADSGEQCSCRGGTCGPGFCSIRTCAREKGVEVCAFCGDYPCERIMGLAHGYPTLLADGKRIQEKGLEAWIAEQETRAGTGFAYADIRTHPYSVPR